ncbi:protein ALP1-like [Daucus carota subsp. sativus]|uniref:protein ALP1-like n=1 Tax=Daucus carota subsp. sativus TaxID=79200 RepID=UPI0030826CB4
MAPPSKGLTRKGKQEKEFTEEVEKNAGPNFQASLPSGSGSFNWWDQFSKRLRGSLSKSVDSANFELVFKMSRRTFKYICSLVEDAMIANSSNFTDLNGQPLALEDQVAIALRRLSSGESIQTVGHSFHIHKATVSNITWRFVEAMEENAIHHIQWPSTGAKMTEVKSKFEKLGGLPNCCGAIDTTHIKMRLPTSKTESNMAWYDKQKNHSMILQAIVDPDMRFLDIFAGCPGCLSDFIALKESGFFKLCNEGKRLNGETVKLPEGTELREYIVGDLGFPLLPWLLTPYRGKNLPENQASFNRRHTATWEVAQKALSLLKDTWKIIDGEMGQRDKDRLPEIVLVCCLLHNISIDLNDEVQKEIPITYVNDPEYRQQICDSVDNAAAGMRSELSLYLSGRVLPE